MKRPPQPVISLDSLNAVLDVLLSKLSTEFCTEVMFDLAVTILLMATSNSRCDKAPWGQCDSIRTISRVFLRDEKMNFRPANEWPVYLRIHPNWRPENHLNHPPPWLWVQNVNFPKVSWIWIFFYGCYRKTEQPIRSPQNKFDEVQLGRWDFCLPLVSGKYTWCCKGDYFQLACLC